MDRLTSDSIAAQRAGMTYGKWKALHPNTDVNVQPVTETRRCVICGREITKRSSTSGRQRKLYCSSECSYEAIKNRERARYHKREDKKNGKI